MPPGPKPKPIHKSFRRRFKSTEPGSITIESLPGQSTLALVLRIPKKIRSLNKLKSGIARHGDTVSWEAAMRKLGHPDLPTQDHAILYASLIHPIIGKRKLVIERQAPTERYFLDQTNFAGGIKGLEDTLVRLGYLVDDSLKWLDGPHLVQTVAADRKFWAVITISEAAVQ